ncbi:hypothetical protein NQ317_005100 [Molorchus minor]|uniref:Salivary secreted peptide n=1 Tax=Molorchus minor TaxID=1323400 RepID=A0ABQ9JH23_9CUCU|nr:hypothetical protein NQ317_005100 [Molorchus minor]
MSATTFFVYIVVLLASFCDGFVCPRSVDSHNIDQCDMTKANLALLQTNVYEPAAFLSTVKRTVTYPETIPDEKHIISCIKVTNLDASDNGGYPKIINGGIGSYDVQLLLVSQWSRPLNFRIEIWAEY